MYEQDWITTLGVMIGTVLTVASITAIFYDVAFYIGTAVVGVIIAGGIIMRKREIIKNSSTSSDE